MTVWYTAPTALRIFMKAGADVAKGYDLTSRGRRPAGPGRDGRGAIDAGHVDVIDQPGVDGELALRAGWPSMFRRYLHEQERYERCFTDGWYLTGDVARRDDDGWLWFVGRADDVIMSAGHLIGPFEVESVLMEHRAVVEAGVIGVPDPVAGEVVKAFVSLRSGHEPSEELRVELLALARRRLGAAVAPGSSRSTNTYPRPGAARSCDGSCGPANSASPKVTCRRWPPATCEGQPTPSSSRVTVRLAPTTRDECE